MPAPAATGPLCKAGLTNRILAQRLAAEASAAFEPLPDEVDVFAAEAAAAEVAAVKRSVARDCGYLGMLLREWAADPGRPQREEGQPEIIVVFNGLGYG